MSLVSNEEENIKQEDGSYLVAKEPRVAQKRVKLVKLPPSSPNTKSARQAAFKARCVGMSPAEIMDAARLIPAERSTQAQNCSSQRIAIGAHAST